MKLRPINFKAHEVRAISEGRKTQTRRIINPQPSETHWDTIPGYKLLVNGPHNLSCGRLGWRFQHCIPQNPVGDKPTWAVCPYGKPGDRLWVRETWQHCQNCGGVDYAADVNKPRNCRHCDASLGNWKPSIHMFREDSRITLEIVSVRVERLNAIDADDAESEGCGCGVNDETGGPVARYRTLWESINGTCSWDLNPWVWVVEFKEVK